MEKKKSVNIKKTAKNIMDKCSRSIGYSIDMKKFTQRLKNNDEKFFIDAAKFCEVSVVYN